MAYNKSLFTSGSVIYKDLDISFKSNPNTGDLRTKTNEDAIKQSLKTLIYTNFGERPFRPELYGGITQLLFEPMDQVTKLILSERLITLFSNWEPRIEVKTVEILEQDFDRNSLSLSISYNILNVSEIQTLELILKRAR